MAPERLLRVSGLLGEGDRTRDLPAQNQGPRLKNTKTTVRKNKEDVGNLDVSRGIEEERLREMKYAKAWDELDSLHEELLKGNEASDCVPTIGHFNDIAGYGISYR